MVKVCTGIPLPVLTLINADASRRTISTRISTSYRGGFTPALRAALFKRFEGLETKTCPFKNLPEARRGQWGEGLTAAEMQKCRWLRPKLVATIDYLERTVANHLRHAMFVGLSKKSALRGS